DNLCNKSDSLCGANSQCLHTGPSTYECVCDEGYHNLRNVCIPLDPCLVNNGGCDSTQDCISQSPSQENDTFWNYYYKLTYGSAYTEKSKIIARDIVASNGAIHLISDVMGLKDNQFEDSKETVMDLIKHQPDYSTMYSMIRAANLSEMFSQPNITVLITNNRAWTTLSLHDQNYLATDTDGLARLAVILKLHIFPGVIDVTDLINLQTMKSIANIQFKVHVSLQGLICVRRYHYRFQGLIYVRRSHYRVQDL
ncbi:unnamed protein product, partial [Candidula unifasciata]